ncbi:unnamed protein product, partial [Callosobruchus maculatus]
MKTTNLTIIMILLPAAAKKNRFDDIADKSFTEYLEQYDVLPRKYISDIYNDTTNKEFDHKYGIRLDKDIEKFRIDLKTKLKVGDHVRISMVRGIFDKKYQPNWSTEIFRIHKMKLTNPTTYLLKDENNQNILGEFYKEQLQTVKYPNVYPVEKVLRTKGDQILVSWLGYGPSKNSWMNKKDIV